MDRLEVGFGERLRSFAKPWELTCFVWVPAIGIGFAAWSEFRARISLEDFGVFRTAALAVVHGRSPYVDPIPATFSHLPFVYPPAGALLFAPFAAIPSAPAAALMFIVGLAAILGALRIMRVEDWRCYGVAIVSAPAVNSVALGALTSLLLLGVAICWRYRGNPAVVGAAAAVTALLKLFLWPLAVWLIATRRWRATVVCVGVGLLVLLGGWAVIGFAGLRSYPALLHALERVEVPLSYSLVALLGVSGVALTAVTVILSLGAALGIVLAAQGRDGDRRAFVLAVFAALLTTPLLWMHYLLLLFVPIAVYRPRLSGLWFLPLLLWLTPSSNSHGATWRIVLALAVMAAVAIRTTIEGAPLSQAGAAPRPAAS